MRDFTELDRQLDNAEAHAIDPNAPGRKWSQDEWIAHCGTYGCIAGNTVLGNVPVREVRPRHVAWG